MEYILDSDYDNIMAKNGERFKRNDALFNEESGMAAEDIMLGIKKIADELKDQPHPIVKAKAFEYILKNTRISCDSRDRYPAINMIDRPLNSTIVSAWSSEVFGKIIP